MRNECKNVVLSFLQHNRLKDREGDETITKLNIIEVKRGRGAASGICEVRTSASVIVNEIKFPDFSCRRNHFSAKSAASSSRISVFTKCTKIYHIKINLVTSLFSIS